MKGEVTPEQAQAICSPIDSHMRMPSVAGSGKSTTLVNRIVYLLQKGVDPTHIRAVMFNRSARTDFQGKLQRQIPGVAPDVLTFHQLGNRILGTFVQRGWLPKGKIENRQYVQMQIGKQVLLNIINDQAKDVSFTQTLLEEFLFFVDRVKAEMETADEVFAMLGLNNTFWLFVPAFELFEEVRLNKGIRFFSDLIYDPVQILKTSSQACALVKNHITHLLVDEYQDINPISQYLIKTVAGSRASVTAVGDADQCIYEWRGSRPNYMVSEFDKDFAGAIDHKLTHTFRFGHALSLLANHIIVNNMDRDDKICLSHKSTKPTAIDLYRMGHPNPILTIAKDWEKSGRKLREMAVLVRLYSMSIPIELALLSNGIPYRIEGHESVLHIQEINALLGILRLANGSLFSQPEIELAQSLRDVFSIPHLGLKQNIIDGLCARIAANPQDAVRFIREAADNLPEFQVKEVYQRANLWNQITSMGSCTPETILTTYLVDSFLVERVRKMTAFSDDAEEKIEAIHGFIAYAKASMLGLPEFIAHIDQLRQNEQDQVSENTDCLLITSIHRSKGLDWPLVVIPDMAEGRFPHIRKVNGKQMRLTQRELESERRLCYVAVTRAKERLTLLFPPDDQYVQWMEDHKTGYPPNIEGLESSASRFLYEANVKLSLHLGRNLHETKCAGVSIPLASPSPEIANRYLNEHGIPGRVSLL